MMLEPAAFCNYREKFLQLSRKATTAGSAIRAYSTLEYKNKKLCILDLGDNVDWDKIRTITNTEKQRKDLGGGVWVTVAGKGSSISIDKEGYYILAINPFVSQYYITDPKSAEFTKYREGTSYKYGYAVIHVVADEK